MTEHPNISDVPSEPRFDYFGRLPDRSDVPSEPRFDYFGRLPDRSDVTSGQPRYSVRIGFVGGYEGPVPTHLIAHSHATEGRVEHEYVRADIHRAELVRLREDRDRILEQSDERWQKLDAALTARDEARTWRVEFERLANQRAAEVERLNDTLDAFTARNTRLAAEVERLREEVARAEAINDNHYREVVEARAEVERLREHINGISSGKPYPTCNAHCGANGMYCCDGAWAWKPGEVERLREQNEKLCKALAFIANGELARERNEARAEVERLRAYVRWCHNRQGEAPLTLEEVKAIVDSPPSDITAPRSNTDQNTT